MTTKKEVVKIAIPYALSNKQLCQLINLVKVLHPKAEYDGGYVTEDLSGKGISPEETYDHVMKSVMKHNSGDRNAV